jgi:hypothetical protein
VSAPKRYFVPPNRKSCLFSLIGTVISNCENLSNNLSDNLKSILSIFQKALCFLIESNTCKPHQSLHSNNVNSQMGGKYINLRFKPGGRSISLDVGGLGLYNDQRVSNK